MTASAYIYGEHECPGRENTMATPSTTRLYNQAARYAEGLWGRAFTRLTIAHQRALVSEEILGLLYQQDATVSDAKFRELALSLIEMNRELFEAKLEAEGPR